MSFQCTIVTPDRQVLDEQAASVVLPAHDGQVGILTGRAPLLVKLGVGVLTVTPTGGRPAVSLVVDGGIAQMKDNRLTILTQDALPPDQIDPAAAAAELAEATALRVTDEASFEQRQHDLQKARVKLSAAR